MLTHRAGVLPDLLPAHGIENGVVGLADGFRVDWHRRRSSRALADLGCAAARHLTRQAATAHPRDPASEGEILFLRPDACELAVPRVGVITQPVVCALPSRAVQELHRVGDDAHRLTLLLLGRFPLAP